MPSENLENVEKFASPDSDPRFHRTTADQSQNPKVETRTVPEFVLKEKSQKIENRRGFPQWAEFSTQLRRIPEIENMKNGERSLDFDSDSRGMSRRTENLSQTPRRSSMEENANKEGSRTGKEKSSLSLV